MNYGFIFLDYPCFLIDVLSEDTLVFTSGKNEVDFLEPVKWLKENGGDYDYKGQEMLVVCFDTGDTKKLKQDYFWNPDWVSEFIVSKEITITVKKDYDSAMAYVYDDVGNEMSGNFWDFYNECHGEYRFGEFHSVDQFVNVLQKFHEEKGHKVKIKRIN
jgi:hypothetical protein